MSNIVESGEYQNASEALRDALRALQQRRKEDALKLDILRAQVRRGVAALDAGDAVSVESNDLASYLAELAPRPVQRTRRRKRR